MSLTVFSLQAVAETQPRGRDFNHKASGFTLSGGHATAACERCHVDGVFEGTPKNCNGCHALGKYLLAAPKSTSLVLAAPKSDTHIAAKQAVDETNLGSRGKNHSATGFPLSGGHATAACGTCHVGGLFKNTPKNCDGCHALGKRVVATPKSTSHIVTDAPCESCHFNTATWLGARYNHGAAKPGQCTTCHNGRIAKDKHAGHTATTYSCDQCHRTTSWIPATWNHTNNALAIYSGQSCVTCHNPTGVAKNKIQSASHLPLAMAGVTFADCASCHKSYYSFYTAFYDHVGAPTTCQSCHGTYGAPAYTNVKSPTALIHSVSASLPVTTTCNSCHKSFGTFLGARFDHVGATQCSLCHSGAYASSGINGKSSKHIPYTGSPECSDCHIVTSAWAGAVSGAALHLSHLSGITCYTCHGSNTPYPGNGQRTERWPNFHESSKNPTATDCSASGCHKPLGSRGSSYTNWD